MAIRSDALATQPLDIRINYWLSVSHPIHTMATVRHDVLCGTLDADNPLSKLRANGLVWSDVFGRVDSWYEKHIARTSDAYHVARQKVAFPAPSNIVINMMPIKLFRLRHTVPEQYAQYIPMIRQCPVPVYGDNIDRIAYLTIHESPVPVGQSQRRPGLHIERPAVVSDGGIIKCDANDPAYCALAWGLGFWREDIPVDGLYMASNVADSCTVWPVLIDAPEEVTDPHGGIEHMRERLGPGRGLAANEMCWMTDRTPHESAPIRAPLSNHGATTVYRQFFRLVVGRISVWYSKHNTPNPMGLLPDAPISDDDKFDSVI